MIHPYRAPGCGFDPASEVYIGEPCVARSGHRTYRDPTVGAVGLCLGCGEAPGDLLAALSKAVMG